MVGAQGGFGEVDEV